MKVLGLQMRPSERKKRVPEALQDDYNLRMLANWKSNVRNEKSNMQKNILKDQKKSLSAKIETLKTVPAAAPAVGSAGRFWPRLIYNKHFVARWKI